MFLSMLCSAQLPAGAAMPFMSDTELIDSAEDIAVINITQVERVSAKGSHYSYEQKATALVEKVIKGNLPSKVFVYGRRMCKPPTPSYQPGRCLVFLQKDNNLLVCADSMSAVITIRGGKLAWYPQDGWTDDPRFEESVVLRDIARRLSTGSLDYRIPTADESKYADIETVAKWKNPAIFIQADKTIAVRWNQTHRKTIPLSQLRNTVIHLPVSAWPYGKAIAVVQPPPKKYGTPDDIPLNKYCEKTEASIRNVMVDLNVDVEPMVIY
jgi:hypothetical protein